MHISTEQCLQAAFSSHQRGNLKEAEAGYNHVLECNPNHPSALYYLGIIRHQQLNNNEAARLITQALTAQPAQVEWLYHLGIVYYHLHELDKALDCFNKTLSLQPDHAASYYNKGVIYQDRGENSNALSAYQKTLELAPVHVKAHNNSGVILDSEGRYQEALTAYQQVIRLQPDDGEAVANLAGVYKSLGNIQEAIRLYEKALKLTPSAAHIHSNLLFTKHYHAAETRTSLFNAHKEWDKRYGEPRKRFHAPHLNIKDPQKRLHIGYVSGDFTSHPVGFFLLPVLTSHDKTQVKTFCYATTARNSNTTQQLKNHADCWRQVEHLGEEALCQQIRQDSIDILVDLSGHTAHNRLLVFARRPAPVQISWLGYFNTTGMEAIDYFISDNVHAPEGYEAFFTEKLIRLPEGYNCYSPLPGAPAVAPITPAARKGYITFGSFNNSAKINHQVIALWAEILHKVPGSKLMLKAQGFGNKEVRDNCYNQFIAHGIAPERLLFEGWTSHQKTLECYNEIDIALDPFPFSGGLTSCDALWMGVPVVTYAGSWLVSRQTASYLTQIGLKGCITQNPKQYVERAVELSQDIARLSRIRSGLRQRVANSSLCNGTYFTRHLEKAYRQMWEIYIG